MVAVGNDAQFARFAAILGLANLAADDRFRTNARRVAHRAILVPLLAAACALTDRATLLAAMEAEGVPAGPINTVAEALTDPQVVARGMVAVLSAPRAAGGVIPGLRTPIMIDGQPMMAARPAPGLGADTAAILAGWDIMD